MGVMGLWFLCGRKLNKILFYLCCFFAELFGLWPMVIMLKHDLPKQLLSNIFFWKPKIQKILVRWFWKFWREQLLICCDTQSFCPHNFSNCSSPKIICFNNRQVIISPPCMFLLSVYTFKIFYTSYMLVYIYCNILATQLKMTKV